MARHSLFASRLDVSRVWSWVRIIVIISLIWQSAFGVLSVHATETQRLNVQGESSFPTGVDLTEGNSTDWSAGEAESYPDEFSTTITDDLTIHPYGDGSIKFETDSWFDWWAYYPSARNANWDLSQESALVFWMHTENPNYAFQTPLTVRLGDETTGGSFEYTDTTGIIDRAEQTDGLLVFLPLAGSPEWTQQTTGTVSLSHIDYIEFHTDTWDAGFTIWLDGLYLHGTGSVTINQTPLPADDATSGQVTIQAATAAGNPIPDAPVQLGIISGDPIVINDLTANRGEFVTLGNTDANGTIQASIRAATEGDRILVAHTDSIPYLGGIKVSFANTIPVDTATPTNTNTPAGTDTPTSTPTPPPNTVTFETRQWSGETANGPSSAISVFNSLTPANGLQYGKTTISSFTQVSNHTVFSQGEDSSIAYHISTDFSVSPAQAGDWQFRVGADFSGGGTLLVDGQELNSKWHDVWWGLNWGNAGQLLSGTINLPAGNHRLDIYGFESCCDGGMSGQFQVGDSGWQDWSQLTPSTPVSSISASASTAPADGTTPVTITVTVFDQDGNPVQDAPVSITATGHGNLIQPSPTNSDGITQTTITNETAETVTLTARTETTIIGSVDIQFLALRTDPDRSTVTVSAAPTLVANNQDKATLTVTLVNQKGQPQANHAVRLYIPNSANNIFPSLARTNAEGIVTFRLSTARAGEKVVSVIDDTDRVTLSTVPHITFVPGSVNAVQSRIIASAESVAANGTSTVNVDVTAYDSFANPVPGATVTFQLNGNAVADRSMATTDNTGQATFVVTDATPETVTASATIDGVAINNTAQVRFRAADIRVQVSALAISNNGYSTSHAASGFPVTYSITLSNLGLMDANNVSVTDSLPASLTFTSSTPNNPTQNGNELIWNIGQVAPGESVELELTAEISSAFTGSLVNPVAASTSSTDDTPDNNIDESTITVEAPRPVLSLIPASSFVVVTREGSSNLTVTIRNTGLLAMDGAQISPPPSISWVQIDTTDTNRALEPGGETTFQVIASPGAAITPGYYRDFVTIKNPGGEENRSALTFQVTPPKHTLRVVVNNDHGVILPGARVLLQNSDSYVVMTEGTQTQTYKPNASAQADANGIATFNDLEAGNYEYRVRVGKHADATGILVMPSDQNSEATITLTALPALSVSPNAPVLTVLPGQNAVQTFTIQNDGSSTLRDIVITLGDDLPGWIYLGTPDLIPAIEPGQSISFSLFASPPVDETRSIVGGHLTVTAAGGLTAPIALTTKLEAVDTRPLMVKVSNALGQPVTTGGTVTLIRQEESVQDLGGTQTRYHEQYSQPITVDGSTQFASLPPGDYNYVIEAKKYKRNTDTLTVAGNTVDGAPQVFAATVQTDSFDYEWDVQPVESGYDIRLTLTYDTITAAPGLFIPPRYWTFYNCGSTQLRDTITIYNPTNLPLDLTNFSIDVPGTSVSFDSLPATVAPHSSVNVPVTVFRSGDVGRGTVEVPFSYQGAQDPYVTYTLNPSSRTDTLHLGQTFTANYDIAPVVFTPGVVYAVQVEQAHTLNWIDLSVESGPVVWDTDTTLPLTLTAQVPSSLDDGVYQDEIPVSVTGSDGAARSGNLLIEVAKNGSNIQLHTTYELGPILTETKFGDSSGFIEASLQSCRDSGNPGNTASSGGWTWGWAPVPHGFSLQGSQFSPTPAPVPPSFPNLIPPPVVYGDGHQEVRLGIDQHVKLQGEGFNARLSLNAKTDLGNVTVGLRITDPAAENADRTSLFTITPTVPTGFGDIAAGSQASRDWLILPTGLDVIPSEGQTFDVSAVISWVDVNGENLSIETASTPITVLPAPNLEITYRLPKGDRQCTIFPLEVVFHNVGAGTARNVHFSSAQPKLLDDTQLPVSFTIDESAVNGVPQGPSLDLVLGDIPPGGEIIVSFNLKASQPGKFVEFTSDYRQSNYSGQLLKPLISKITTEFVLDSPCGNILSACAMENGPQNVVVGSYSGFLTSNDILPYTNGANTDFSACVYLPPNYGTVSHPVLVFLHGQKTMVQTSERGYAYLAYPLVQRGFIVVSIDGDQLSTFLSGHPWDNFYADDQGYHLARGRLLLRHLELWTRWNLGEDDPASAAPNSLSVENFDPSALVGNVEMGHVGLLGHSRGGEGVRAAYNYLRDAIPDLTPNSQYPWPTDIWQTQADRPQVQAIYEIAPTDHLPTNSSPSREALNAEGVAWNVLLPMCDGDIDQLTGLRPFDRMYHSASAAGSGLDPKSALFVWGANHASFNTEWASQPESQGICSGDYNGNYSDDFESDPADINSQYRLVAAADLQTLAAYTVTEFFRGNVEADPDRSAHRLFNPLMPLPPSLTDITRVERAFTLSPDPDQTTLLVTFQYEQGNPDPNTASGADYQPISMRDGPHAPASPKYDPIQYAGWIEWPQSASQQVPSFQANWLSDGSGIFMAGVETLDLRLARTDSEKNSSDQPTDFSLCLVFDDNTCSTPVKLSKYLSLLGPVGGKTLRPVLQTVRIPLNDFSIDGLKPVRGLRFLFDETSSGSMYVADIGVSMELGHGIPDETSACVLSNPVPGNESSLSVTNVNSKLEWTETNCSGYKRRLYFSDKLIDVALPTVPTEEKPAIEPIGPFYPLADLTLQNKTVYYWRVVAYQDLGNGLTGNVSQSEIWSFTYGGQVPLIFIPGAGGSLLVDTADGRQLWPGLPLDHNTRARLSLYPETNPANTIVSTDVTRGFLGGTVKIYSTLIDELTEGGYVEYDLGTTPSEMTARRTLAGCDTSQMSNPDKPTLFVFPYDWRKSMGETSQALKEYIDCIQELYPGTQVDIVAHSMGGLIPRRYILDNPSDHSVRKLVSIGTPWVGSTKTLDGLENGNFATGIVKWLFVPPDRAKAMIGSFTGGNELLPSRYSFNLGAVPLEEDGWDLLTNQPSTGTKIYDDYSEFVSLLNARHTHPGFTPAPGDANLQFHDAFGQDDWSRDGSGVEYYHFYSIQKKDMTMGTMVATSALDCRQIGPLKLWCSGEKLDWEYKPTVGDRTVSALSASRLMDPGKAVQECQEWIVPNVVCRQQRSDDPANWGLNAPNAHLYAFVSPDKASDKIYEHGVLQDLPSAQDLLIKILTDQEITPVEVGNAHGAQVTVADDLTYYVSINGETEIDVQDDLGNMVTAGTLQDVDLYQASENFSNVVLPTGKNYSVTFQTTSDPLAIEVLEGDSLTITRARRYEDVTLPPNVDVELQLTDRGSVYLRYDADGNGSYETVVPASTDVTGELANDLQAPTVSAEYTYSHPGSDPVVHLTAQDTGTAGIQRIYYSLDGHNFEPYEGPFAVNPVEHSTVYAFADDNVDNRSNLITLLLPASTDQIVFARNYDFDVDLVVMNADGSNAYKLTDDSFTDGQPAWSPDGRQIAFVSNRGNTGYFNLYVMNADGTNIRSLTSGADDYHPAWSPDGQKIAYSDDDGVVWVSLDGAAGGRLTDAQLAKPAWVSNTQIIYSDLADGLGQLYLEDIYHAGMGRRQYLTEGHSPAVSPDGTMLAFYGLDDDWGAQSILTCEISNCDSTRQTVTVLPGSWIQGPTWSADGQWIAFNSDFQLDPQERGINAIFKVNVATGELQQLTPFFTEGSSDPKLGILNLGDTDPAWEPAERAPDPSETPWVPGTFEIRVFNVGQADSQLIISPSGKTMLIDIGEEFGTGAVNTNAKRIAQKIKAIMPDIEQIDYLVVSHLQRDHIGNVDENGITQLIDTLSEDYGLSIGQLLDREAGAWQDNQDGKECEDSDSVVNWSKVGEITPLMKKWVCYVSNSGLNRTTPPIGSTIDMGDGVMVTVLQRDAEGYSYTSSTNENYFSLGLKIEFNRLDYITAGDSPRAIESLIANSPLTGSADVIHINHHGADSSTSPTYLQTLQPHVGFISCGPSSNNHPSRGALDRLENDAVITYLTGKCNDSVENNYNTNVYQGKTYNNLIGVQDDIVLRSTDGLTYTVNGAEYTTEDPQAGINSVLFFDDGEEGPDAWIAQGGWTLSTDMQAYSGSYNWSDSPDTFYTPGTISTLTLASPIYLPADQPAKLEFWDPTDLGSGAYASVEISTDNGQTWETLWRRTDVHHSKWYRQVLSLAPYVGKSLLLRFQLTIEPNAQSGDGWHIDDILITTATDQAVPPNIKINAPTASSYLHPDSLTIDFTVTSEIASIETVETLMDGAPVTNGQVIDLYTLALGPHAFTVNAVDEFGNAASQSVEFNVTANLESLMAAVKRFYQEGNINDKGLYYSLMQQVKAATQSNKPQMTSGILNVFMHHVKVQRGRHITAQAADRLIADAKWVITHLPDEDPPHIYIKSPRPWVYQRACFLWIDFDVFDSVTGVKEVSTTLDGVDVNDHRMIDLRHLSLGEHVLTVNAEDYAGNESTKSVTFQVIVTVQSLKASVVSFYMMGDIDSQSVYYQLIGKLEEAKHSRRPTQVVAALESFIQKLRQQSGRHITPDAANELMENAQWIIEHTR